MRISMLLSVVSAAIIVAGVAAVRAQDTPAQAAALAALKQKMSELDTQAGQPAKQPPPVVVTLSGATVQQPSPPPAVKQPAPAPVAVAVPAPAPVPAPVSASDKSDSFTPVPPPSNPQIQAGAQAALQEKTNTSNVVTTSPQTKNPTAMPGVPKEAKAEKEAKMKSGKKATAKEAKPAKPEVTSYPGKALGFNPVEPPPPPVSAEKQEALHALLARYMANEVTPDQYQAERKKILAGQ